MFGFSSHTVTPLMPKRMVGMASSMANPRGSSLRLVQGQHPSKQPSDSSHLWRQQPHGRCHGGCFHLIIMCLSVGDPWRCNEHPIQFHFLWCDLIKIDEVLMGCFCCFGVPLVSELLVTRLVPHKWANGGALQGSQCPWSQFCTFLAKNAREANSIDLKLESLVSCRRTHHMPLVVNTKFYKSNEDFCSYQAA